MHEINELERTILDRMISLLPGEEAGALLRDVADVCHVTRSKDRKIVSFVLSEYKRPEDNRQAPYSVEGRMSDDDGSNISIILFKDSNGRLLEMEMIKWDGGGIVNPDPQSLQKEASFVDVPTPRT